MPVRAIRLFLLAAVLATFSLEGQIASLWYKEAVHEGQIFVFNSPDTFKAWQTSKTLAKPITKAKYGPSGETVSFENETALDLYNIKHNKDSEVRTVKASDSKPAIPTTLKIGDGELKFSSLLQAWYIADSSPASTGTSYLGNTTGVNSFRLRRAEIKLSGKIVPAWGFEVMFDPAKTQNMTSGNDDKILQDLAISFLGLKGHEFAIGQKKIAITEEGLRSSSDLDFAERSRIARVIGDQRQAGFFYKGEYGKMFAAQASITNGSTANANDDSNDTVFWAARFDVKPRKGMVAGISGGTGDVQTDHKARDRFGAHFRWDGDEKFPLLVRFEYGWAKDGQGAGKDDITRDGWYGSVLYTFAKQYQLGLRYEEYDANKDVSGDKLTIVTGGFHYLIKGRNLNLKLDWFHIEQEGRKVNNVLDESYDEVVLAVQASF